MSTGLTDQMQNILNEDGYFNDSIDQELVELGVEFEVLTRDNAYYPTGRISLERVHFKNLGTVVMLFNELDDCVK